MARQWYLVALCVAAVMLSGAAAPAAEAVKAQGEIESVTLYRGQALVTRVVRFDAPAGTADVVIGNLPEQLVPDSLYASAPDGLQVRAVRYRTRAVGEAPREEIRDLDAAIRELEKDLRKIGKDQLVLQEQKQYLEKLQNFVAPTAQAELTHGVLNAKTLVDMSVYLNEQRINLAERAFELKEKETALKEELDLVRRRRSELTRNYAKVEREALVFIDKAAAGAAEIQLSYLVNQATWTPSYNIRAAEGAAGVEVEYNALAEQMSGEDWSGVALTLSTASPTMIADSPVLAPLLVTLRENDYGGNRSAQMPGQAQADQQAWNQDIDELKGKYKKAQQSLREQQGLALLRDRKGSVTRNWEMNTASNQFQELELAASGSGARALRELQEQKTLGLSVNYGLPGKTSVASRSDQQIVRIAKLSLPAEFRNVAIPLLGEEVYRQASITNNSEIALLEGRTTVYLENDFVGNGTIPMVARGQRFIAGFGTDPQLRAWREFVSRDERFQGGNREVSFQYRLVLDNYNTDEMPVRVFDRLPYTPSGGVRVTLGEMTDELSDDKEYLRAWRPHNILRWDIAVPAGAAATTARIVRYDYTLEYDRNKSIRVLEDGKADPAIRATMMDMMDAR